jgi:bla regulator protein BlaR1
MKILNILLEITIYSVVLFCAIMLLKRFFKNKMSPFLHFAIWGLLIARLLIPVTLESSIQLIVLPDKTVENSVTESPVQTPYNKNLDVANYANTPNTVPLQPQFNHQQTTISNTPSVVTRQALSSQQTSSLSTEEILLTIWLVGVAIGLMYLAILYVLLQKQIRKNTVMPSRRLIKQFEEVKAQLHIKGNIRILGQCEYGTPAILFPNTILMPIDTLISMRDEEVKYVLRHEFMHFKRKDHLLSIVLSILNAIYWFNHII